MYEVHKHSSFYQREVELSRERHESDLKEKSRLSRMLDFKVSYKMSSCFSESSSLDMIFCVSVLIIKTVSRKNFKRK